MTYSAFGDVVQLSRGDRGQCDDRCDGEGFHGDDLVVKLVDLLIERVCCYVKEGGYERPKAQGACSALYHALPYWPGQGSPRVGSATRHHHHMHLRLS